jgi:protein-L-isoaspartate O-methyltransferase
LRVVVAEHGGSFTATLDGAASATATSLTRMPREAFSEEGSREFAYEDSPLPTGDGQTISRELRR